MRMNSYETYSFADFLADEYFLTSLANPTPDTERFWADWLAQHPDRRPVWEEARRVALALDAGRRRYEAVALPTDQTETLWSRIRQNAGVAPAETPFVAVHRNPFGRVWRIAAAVAVFLLAALGVWRWQRPSSQPTEIRTAYGQTRRLTLPDGSVVTLNANSRLRYDETWTTGTDRRVQLDGEAFFEVTHLPSNARFVVHTAQLDVEVLGTKFNVNSRAHLARVTLKEGRVKVADLADRHSLVMKPGETVEWTEQKPVLTQKTVRPERYAAWTEKRLVFDGTPLPEVAQMLEDNFGLTVRIENPALLTKTLSGEIALDTEDLLLQALRDLYGLRVTRTDSTVVLR
jgi:ferric-dicitrate binding protein FerR (iron transport regulator)